MPVSHTDLNIIV